MSGGIPHEILTTAGHPLSAALVIEYLSSGKDLTIRNLTNLSGLTESQVSSGLKQCKTRGWVESHQGEVKGKGRPTNLWNLALPPIELVSQLESAADSKRKLLYDALTRLKDELEMGEFQTSNVPSNDE